MRPILIATLAALLPGLAAADTLSCRLTRACVQGGPCLPADVPLWVEDAAGPRPVMRVGGQTLPVDRESNFYGTVFNGWNNARRPADFPGELWVRPNGRTTYVRRADVDGVTIRTDYRGRCAIIPGPDGPGGAPALK